MGFDPLEQAISADSDDASFLVLADALMARGDPRGELIAVQARLAELPGDKTLKAREQALLERHALDFYGVLRPSRSKELNERSNVKWRLGFWSELTLDGRDRGHVAAALACASARFLRRLHLHSIGRRPLDIDGLTHPTIEALGLNSDVVALPTPNGLPRLTELTVSAGELVGSGGPMAAFVRASFEVTNDAQALARTSWPELRELSLRFSSSILDGAAEVQRWLFSGESLPNVETLALSWNWHRWALFRALAGAPLTRRLRRLLVLDSDLDAREVLQLEALAGQHSRVELELTREVLTAWPALRRFPNVRPAPPRDGRS